MSTPILDAAGLPIGVFRENTDPEAPTRMVVLADGTQVPEVYGRARDALVETAEAGGEHADAAVAELARLLDVDPAAPAEQIVEAAKTGNTVAVDAPVTPVVVFDPKTEEMVPHTT